MYTNIYSKERLQMFKDAFLVVKGKALTCPELLSYGVCYNAHQSAVDAGLVSDCDNVIYVAINALAKGWPSARMFTGSNQLLTYFVPFTSGYSFWQGPNLEMRLDLLDYLIAKCDALIAEQE